MDEATNTSIPDTEIPSFLPYCEVYTKWDRLIINRIEYYIEGVAVCCVAVPGLLTNIVVTVLQMRQKSMDSIFHSLLSILFLCDSLICFIGLTWSFQQYFDISSNVQIILFPIFFYPLKNISMTASIFMTVAIAHERYEAIRDPMIYRQMIVNPTLRKKHLVKYLLLIITVSVLFNIPKFFESEVKWIHDTGINPTPHHRVDDATLRYLIM